MKIHLMNIHVVLTQLINPVYERYMNIHVMNTLCVLYPCYTLCILYTCRIYCVYAYHAIYTVYERVMNIHVVDLQVGLAQYTQYMNGV